MNKTTLIKIIFCSLLSIAFNSCVNKTVEYSDTTVEKNVKVEKSDGTKTSDAKPADGSVNPKEEQRQPTPSQINQ